MFNNIGGNLKTAAKVFFVIGVLLSLIYGLIIMFNAPEIALQGFLYIIIGILLAWISSLILYGFGQLIDNTNILVEQGRMRATNQNNNK